MDVVSMRIDRVLVDNFHNVQYAEAGDLGSSPVVTIGGRNGAGKTTFLRAIAYAWALPRGFPVKGPPRLPVVGPWSEECIIELDIALTDEEWSALEQSLARSSTMKPERPSTVTLRKRFIRSGPPAGYAVVDERDPHPWARYLVAPGFRMRHPFAHIDYFPSHRTLISTDSVQIDPALTDQRMSEDFRRAVQTEIDLGYQRPVELLPAESFLATIHYLDLIARDQPGQSVGDFEQISAAFEQATGKRILPPQRNEHFSLSLLVETPSGHTHSLRELSSGEREVLGVMCYLRRLRGQGGVLLLDEPELHLHPALQRSLFDLAEDVGLRAQVWNATHSPALLGRATSTIVLHMTGPSGSIENQLRRATDEPGLYQLRDDLGFRLTDLLQSDKLILVEGPTDEENLTRFFPMLVTTAAIRAQGSAGAVEEACRVLSKQEVFLPWIAVRDRDMLTDEEVSELMKQFPNLFIWRRRMLENELLEPQLISTALEYTGMNVSEEEVLSHIKDLALQEKEEVLRFLMEQRLNEVTHARYQRTGSPVDNLRAYLESDLARRKEQLERFPELLPEMRTQLEQVWATEWLRLVNGKRVLHKFIDRHSPYKDRRAFCNLLARTVHMHPDLLPQGLSELKERLEVLERP